MRFTEFLNEAPLPGGQPKRRVRPVGNKYPNLKPQDQYVAPNMQLFKRPRKAKAKPAPAPAPAPQPQLTKQQSIEFPEPNQDRQGDVFKGPPADAEELPGNPRHRQPDQQGLNFPDPQRQGDLFNGPASKSEPELPGNPKNAKSIKDPWKVMVQNASQDASVGREYMTLLGAMYQAKRRNPTVQMTLPKMVTSMPEKTPEEQQIKAKMTTLFNMAKADDLPHLAARANEIQKSRSMSGGKPANALPTQQPGQPAQQPTEQQSKQALGTGGKLRQVFDFLKKANVGNLQQIKDAAVDALKKKKPAVQLPQRNPGVVGTG